MEYLPHLPESLYDNTILVDTSAFFALINSHDQYHKEATDCLKQILINNLPLLITNTTVIETHRLILNKRGLGYNKATKFLKEIYNGGYKITRVLLEDEVSARKFIFKYDDQTFTYTDAISFSVMKRLGIGKVFSFDSQFEVIGFIKIPPFV